ncbi:DUF2301 domain-containing membrane protein [Aestuariirhabdus sp. LZHN29]|uniref:DUF2301 domain-containing membrane protein n=1 Tax=Aestuariirhabdus sp. LZHN29 TaxID=3417462 RepID=UPI003CF8C4B6
MADPDVVEKLDVFDRALVVIYRSAITLAALYFLLAAGVWFAWSIEPQRLVLLMLSATMMATSLHIYAKIIRYLLLLSTLLGILWVAVGASLGIAAHPLVAEGLLLVTVSGVAYKESHCFRVPGLQWMPLLLLVLVLLRYLHSPVLAPGVSLVAAVLMGYLSIKKWQMPLYFDIGDRSKYQN